MWASARFDQTIRPTLSYCPSAWSRNATGVLGDRVAGIARRGIEPANRETYDNGVTKVTYRDADGNEISLGGPSTASM